MEWINFAFVKALGITLFHSIWQATLIAFIMSVILSFVKRENAKSRYFVALLSMFILFGVFLFTMFKVYGAQEITISPIDENNPINIYSDLIVVSNEKGSLVALKEVLINNIQWITLIWGIGMLFFFAKITFGLRFITKLVNSSSVVTSDWILKLMEELKKKANLERNVQLKESQRIQQASVVGVLKPIIYFPIGLINNLSPEEAEAIIAHEIAHIIRNDYIINIIQSIIETFFYFHPAVWWISANIRNEREHACDDLAIAIIGDKVKYAKSLLLLQEWENKVPVGMVMNLSTKSTPLFDRMRRILSQPKNKHEMKQKIWASVILMSSIVWISATEAPIESDTVKTAIKKSIVEPSLDNDEGLELSTAIQDTIPEKIKDSKSTIVELKNGKIKRLNIDGEEIPEEEFSDHSIYFNQVNPDVYMWIDSSHFRDLADLRNYQFDFNVNENVQRALEKSRLLTDSMRFNMEDHYLKLDSMRFHFDDHFKEMDERFKDMEFPKYDHNFHFHQLDTMRFDMDSLRSRMETLGYHFEDMGRELGHMFDSIDFPQIGRDMKFYFDSFAYPHIERSYMHLDSFVFPKIREGMIHLDSFKFPEFDHDFDFIYKGSLENSFERALKRDELYKEGGNTLILEYDRLEINGEQQSEEMLKKYKEIYERNTGVELLEGSSLNIKLTGSKSDGLKRL